MTLPRARLAGYDWVVLMASLVLGGVAGYLGLLLGIRLLLEPRIVSETALRLSKYTVLVEEVLGVIQLIHLQHRDLHQYFQQ